MYAFRRVIFGAYRIDAFETMVADRCRTRLINGGGRVLVNQKSRIDAVSMQCKLIDPPLLAQPCLHRSARRFSKDRAIVSIAAEVVKFSLKGSGGGCVPPGCSRLAARYVIIMVLWRNRGAAGLIPRNLYLRRMIDMAAVGGTAKGFSRPRSVVSE